MGRASAAANEGPVVFPRDPGCWRPRSLEPAGPPSQVQCSSSKLAVRDRAAETRRKPGQKPRAWAPGLGPVVDPGRQLLEATWLVMGVSAYAPSKNCTSMQTFALQHAQQGCTTGGQPLASAALDSLCGRSQMHGHHQASCEQQAGAGDGVRPQSEHEGSQPSPIRGGHPRGTSQLGARHR